MKSKLLLIVLLCCASSTIAGRRHEPTPSEFSCPNGCDCDKLNYYKESKCSRNGSSLKLILTQTSSFSADQGNHLIVNCTTSDQFAYEILSEFNFVNLVFIRYNGCPLPLSKLFSQIHSGLYQFHFNTTERISVGRDYFSGWNNLQQLHLRSSSTIDLTDDVITGLPYLKDLTIISNEINEKIFDRPSNVISLRIGGVNDEFDAEMLKKWTQLWSFSLTDSKIQNLSKKHMPNVPNIDRVALKYNEIATFDSDTFESLHRLQSISLKNIKIANMPQRLIVKSESFEFIRIECDEETGFDTLPDEFLSNLPKLKIVEIMDCNMKSLAENLLRNSTKLYRLNLSNNLLTDLPGNFLVDQNELANIDLSSNRFSEISVEFLENLLIKPVWRNDRIRIYFTNNNVERLSREIISILSLFNGHFDFSGNSITDLSGFDGMVKYRENSFVNVERNPINCNCSSVNAFKKYGRVTPVYLQSHTNNTICATPLNLNGTAVINVDC